MTARPIETVDTLIVGGGQAGLAPRKHLTARAMPHLILERGRTAERWDSLVANGPAWHDRFPSWAFDDLDTGAGLDSHDPAEQARKAMRNVLQLLREAGAETAHLCKPVIYLTDVRHREPVYRVIGEMTRSIHCVSTGLVVVALPRPNWLVEIDATAVIPE